MTSTFIELELERLKKRKIPRKIMLDVGCGAAKHQGFLGMDRRALDGVDIVYDAELIPWPLDNEACNVIAIDHFIEHVKPWLTIEVLDECWRILVPEGIIIIATPYGGSPRYFQDPTHCNPWNRRTPFYFDPNHSSKLYLAYTPKPWHIIGHEWEEEGDLNVTMEKLKERV